MVPSGSYLKSHCQTHCHLGFSHVNFRNFIVLHYILQSVIHFKFIFVKDIRSVSRFFFFFFASECSVVQVPFVEKTLSSIVLSLLSVKDQLTLFIEVYLWDLEKAMAPHSSTFAWKIPWMEGPGRLQSMGLPRVGHDWATTLSLFTFMPWRRKWQPTPVFLPGESQGRGSLVGCRLWGRTESDTTEAT